MSSEEINVIAIITPKPGKLDEVEVLVSKLCAEVKAKEPGVLGYQAHVEKKKDGSGSIVMVEK